jgi:hypothetical protein
LVFIAFKIGMALDKEFLKNSFIFLIGTRLIYFISLGLLNYIKSINLLLEGCDLFFYFFNSIFITVNTRGNRSLRRHYMFILLS